MQCMLKILSTPIHFIVHNQRPKKERGNSFPVLTLTFSTYFHKYSGADLSKF